MRQVDQLQRSSEKWGAALTVAYGRLDCLIISGRLSFEEFQRVRALGTSARGCRSMGELQSKFEELGRAADRVGAAMKDLRTQLDALQSAARDEAAVLLEMNKGRVN